MVSISVTYDGDLLCTATHGPSGQVIKTDAPVDNQGKGSEFSPTDLVATAVGTCVATTMAIVARRKGLELPALKLEVGKEMSEGTPRKIGRVSLKVIIPLPGDHPDRALLERAAHNCPVSLSLHPDVVKDISFVWSPSQAQQDEAGAPSEAESL